MGLVTEKEIVRVLSEQLNVPQIDLSNYLIEPSTVKLIPEHVARRHQLIPINKVGNKLTVAMVDPLNILAIDDVALMTGLSGQTGNCYSQGFK
jgi:type IV pilus assembly protein PilB